MRLDALAPGARFRVPALDRMGTLLALRAGSAAVVYEGAVAVEVARRDGQLARFLRAPHPVTVSRAIEVERLDGDTP